MFISWAWRDLNPHSVELVPKTSASAIPPQTLVSQESYRNNLNYATFKDIAICLDKSICNNKGGYIYFGHP
jgi:hypothetical protein